MDSGSHLIGPATCAYRVRRVVFECGLALLVAGYAGGQAGALRCAMTELAAQLIFLSSA